MPNVSVITINFNDRKGLERTILSVLSQDSTGLEFVVIDGGSTDGSVDVIKKYETRITAWISEKDNGIYDAQNKGIAKATGDHLLFLNSGDSFHDADVLKKFNALNSSKKLIYGNANVIDGDGASRAVIPPDVLDLNFWYANTLTHQAVFIHRSLFEKYGTFNTAYRYGADFDFLFRVFVKEPSAFFHFSTLVCNFDNTGLTSLDKYHQEIIKERKAIMKSHVKMKEFNAMKRNYLSSLPFKRRWKVIIRENDALRTLLKPFYKLYKQFSN